MEKCIIRYKCMIIFFWKEKMYDNSVEKPLRVVATFTTLPERYELLEKSIKSIREQSYPVDAIYLAIPMKARRLNKEYPQIPDSISNLCTVLRIDIDYGPITKIYGALVSETNPNTVIISCDDDVIYNPDMIRIMIQHHKTNPHIAICGTGALIGRGLVFLSIVSSLRPFRKWNVFTGFDVGKEGRSIDVVFGVAGVLYLRGFFPNKEQLHSEIFKYCFENEAVFLNDDILISGYLNKQNITRKVFCDIPDVVCQNSNRTDALSHGLIKQVRSVNQSINYLMENGFFSTTEVLPLDETIAVKIVINIILIIILLVLAILLYQLI